MSAPAQLVPDFFIVGHQKSGTTALYYMLKEHPQIFLPEMKEPRYFATDLRSRLPAPSPAAKRLHTLDGYLDLYAPALPGQLRGDASPQYLRSDDAAAGIAELRPDARLIAILREPASFVRSFHLQSISSETEDERDLRTALALEDERREGKHIPPRCHDPKSLLYAEHVHYTEQLERFHAAFPRENMLVLIYDDFNADNQGTVRKVLRFLGADDEIEVERVQTTPIKAVRWLAIHQLVYAARKARHNPAASSRFGRIVNALTPEQLRRGRVREAWVRAVYKEPAPPDPELTLEMRRRFKGEVEAVSSYLGRDLVTQWGYDKIP